jgi:hypothetical protein
MDLGYEVYYKRRERFVIDGDFFMILKLGGYTL